MKDLQNFKSNLPEDCILDATASEEIKGGFRFITKDVMKFVSKVYQLIFQGKSINWGKHGDEYCVEW